MPHFTYTAKTPDGGRRSGTIEAPNRPTALARIEQGGAVPVTLTETAAPAGGRARAESRRAAAPPARSRRGGRRVRRRDVLLFTRELSDLLASGMTLGGALHTLAGRPGERAIRTVVTALRDAIVRGDSLSQALGEWPRIFPKLYVSMVRAGEVSGGLAESLERLAAHFERIQEARDKVAAALVYPGIVLSFGFLTVAFIMAFVIPRFAAMFDELGGALPLPTRMLVGVSDVLAGWGGLLLLAVLAGGVVAFRRAVRTPSGRRAWHSLLLRVPLVRGIVSAHAFAQFAETLASLLANGVPVLDALRIVEDTVGNEVIGAEIRAARDRVTDGSTIAGPLAAGRVFPVLLTDMLAVGERTGDMSGSLRHIARRYSAELDRRVKTFTTVLEPLMIVIVALVIGLVAISMLLAVFDLTSGLNV